jgi:hypothetical protein
MNIVNKLTSAVVALGFTLTQVGPALADCIRERDSISQTFTCSVAQDGVSLQASGNPQALNLAIQQASSVRHTGFDSDGNTCVQTTAGNQQCPFFIEEHDLVAR